MSVLLRPDFPEEPMSVWYLKPPMSLWYEIRTLDGRQISATHSLGDGKWQWITDVIKGDAECDYDDIDIEESDEGDFITVQGERYARVRPLKEDFSETEEHKQAMEERETITANAAALMEIARLKAQVAYLTSEVETWKDRYEAADEALGQTIRDFDKLLNEGPK